MIKNFFLTAIRNLNRNKGYTLMNVLGLAAGLTCFAFIAVWVTNELSYDSFNKKADRIVRVVGKVTTASETFEHSVSPVPMAQAFKADYPEVENTVRLDPNDAIVKSGDKQFVEPGIIFTDPSFFDVFSYKLKQGDIKTVLSEPYTIILTESMAKKYFGESDPINKTLTIFLYDSTGRGANYKVTGIMQDANENAHFNNNFLASFKTVEKSDPESLTQAGWGDNGYYTYLLLNDKTDIPRLAAHLPEFTERHIGKEMKEWQMHYDYYLQPLRDIHLHSNRRYEIAATGSMQYIYIFGAIGVFILLIAGINYMNLATARSVQRAKEVGVRKVMGAGRHQLIFQYLAEAVLVALISLVVAFIFTGLLSPALEQLIGKDLSVFQSPPLLIFLVGVTLLLGMLSGLYPAFFITAYRPVNVLKGAFKSSSGGVWLRKTLVVVQFTISVVLIIGILVVNSQLSFIQHKDLGYKKDALLTLKVNGNTDVIEGFPAFKNTLTSSPLIAGVTTSGSLLTGGLGNSGATTVTKDGKPVVSSIYRLRMENNFIDVYEMKMLAGRKFSSNPQADSSSFILNEAAVRSFGWGRPEDAINKPFTMGGRQGTVIGIVKDFHFNSMQHPVEPLAMTARQNEARFSQITVRIDMARPKEAVDMVAATWNKHFPGAVFEYAFLDRKLNDQYKSEERFAKFFLYFSALSLLIACLGLFGLTAYATQQRVKEIGVRKVLGASVAGITTLLSKDFLKLVIIAAVIAFPIAWWMMNKWLSDFVYRINISVWVFAAAGIIALVIAMVTVGFQSIKAAMMKPVKSLRTE